MFENLFIFAVSLFIIIKSATLATKYAVRVAESFHLSKYIVGFIIIAVISILPEAFIFINSAFKGIPSFGLGTLFGSNVADLTLVFAIIIMLAGRGIKVESKILKNNAVFPLLLLIPIILGLDGHYSRVEGAVLIIAGAIFYYFAFKNSASVRMSENGKNNHLKNCLLLILSMAALLIGSHFTVVSAANLAQGLKVSPILIGILIVGLGATIPELLFSLKSMGRRDDSLAVGDILGTVLADETMVLGLLIMVNPFSFPPRIIYVTGMFLVLSSFLLSYLMRTGRIISKKESWLLFLYWIVFVLTEFFVNK